jgi:multiple sugar transport system permease protein
LTVLALICSLALLFPVYWMFHTAVSPTADVLSRNPALLPTDPSTKHFATLLSSPATVMWFWNSGVVTLVSAVVSTSIAVLAGYALSRFRLTGGAAIGFTILLGRVLPGTLIALPIFLLFRAMGLINTLPAVMLANVGMILPFATLLMRSYFDSIPRALDEAARVDGCSRLGALRLILLPLASTGIAATLIFAATASWVDLLFARTLVFDSTLRTVPVGISNLISDTTTNWNVLMAAGTLSVLPVFVLYWFAQRFLIEGFTAGSLKG